MRNKQFDLTPGDIRRIEFWLIASHVWDCDPQTDSYYVPGVGPVSMEVLQAVKLKQVGTLASSPDDEPPSESGG